MKPIRGFTLLELMVVVAIIAILSSLAISIYQRSLGKAQLSEAFTIADGIKVDIAAYRHQTGACPSTGIAGIQHPASYAGNYVASARVHSAASGCVITVLMRNHSVSAGLHGKKVVFTMAAAATQAVWTCSSDAPRAYLPQACR